MNPVVYWAIIVMGCISWGIVGAILITFIYHLISTLWSTYVRLAVYRQARNLHDKILRLILRRQAPTQNEASATTV